MIFRLECRAEQTDKWLFEVERSYSSMKEAKIIMFSAATGIIADYCSIQHIGVSKCCCVMGSTSRFISPVTLTSLPAHMMSHWLLKSSLGGCILLLLNPQVPFVSLSL